VTTVSHPLLTSEIAARVERLPLTRWQIGIRCVIGVVTFFDAFDQLLVSFLLPSIGQEWSLSQGQSTWAVTAGSVGMLIGALLSGRLADRFGRVRTIVVSLFLYALSSLVLAASPSLAFFMALRFLQGVGIGGEVPVAATYISEITRARHRGRFVLLYELIFPIGIAAAALVASWVVPAFGWRWMLVIGGLPLPAVFLIHRYVPESPRWLAARGLQEQAEAAMAYIERKVAAVTGQPLPEPAPVLQPPGSSPPASVRALFAGRYRRRTLTVWLLWFTSYFTFYGIATWLPSIYRDTFHLSLAQSLTYSLYGSLAGVAGAVLIALTIDRVGRRWAIGLSMIIGGLLLGVLWLLGAQTALQMVIWCSLATVFINAVNLALYLYTPELYPTVNRALGSSLAGAWNRVGVIVGPIVFAAFYGSGGIVTILLILAAVAVLGGVVALVAADETAGRTLEEVNA
jgi:putative MFS transporter